MIVTANGVDLYVEAHGAGDPVLLLHGWPDSADLWRDVTPALTAAGYQVITPDQRGFGRSSCPADLSRPGALTATLNWYRANLAPRMPGPPPELPPVTAPTLGIWSAGDRYLDGARMRASGELIQGSWRYAEISGATHWIPLDAPEELNGLILDWLAGPPAG